MAEASVVELIVVVLLQLLLRKIVPKPTTRQPCLKRKRIDWEAQAQLLEDSNRFQRAYKMSRASFDALLALLTPSLEVDEQHSVNRTGIEPITPANKLQMFLRYMSGGSSHDVCAHSGVSDTAFYDAIHQVTDCILQHPDLQIKFPEDDAAQREVMDGFRKLSNGGVMIGCVGAVDGWLCQIEVPAKDEVDKVRPFYSGHYRCYGVNVQACCDHHSRFTSVSIAAPGGTGDSVAYQEWGLAGIVQRLPLGRYIVGDNAYANENTLLTPFPRPSIAGEPYRDSFNYHLSQLRIRIEMAFGLLVRKWRIFRAPLQVKFENVARVVLVGCTLHNWCINRRLLEDPEYQAQHDEILLEAVSQIRPPTTTNDGSNYTQLYLSPAQLSRRRELLDNDKGLVRNAIVNILRGNTQMRPHRNIMRRARAAANV